MGGTLIRHLAIVAVVLVAQHVTEQQSRGGVIYPVPNMAISILADTIKVDEPRNSATYSGNVQIVQGHVRVHCTKAIVQYERSISNNTPTIARIQCEQ